MAAKTVQIDNTPITLLTGTSGVVGTPTAASATLVPTPGRLAYVTSIDFSGSGSTAASVAGATLSGLAAGTISYELGVPAGVTTPAIPFVQYFDPPLPASGPGVTINWNVPGMGSGSAAYVANAYGYMV